MLSENRARALRPATQDGGNCLGSLGAAVLSAGDGFRARTVGAGDAVRAGDGFRARTVGAGDAVRAGDGFRARTMGVGDAVRAGAVRVGTLRGAGFLPSEWNRACD
jgi:hypothetical protein